jgi:hypothetical protein
VTRRILLTALAIVVLVVAYVAYWQVTSRIVERAITDWMADEREAGARVEASAIEVGGFPLAIAATAEDIVLERPDGLSWHGRRLIAEARPWSLGRIAWRLDGGQRVDLPSQPPVAIEAASGDGSLAFGGGRAIAGSLALAEVVATAEALGGAVTAASVAAAAEQPDGLDLRVESTLTGLALPRSPLPTLGPAIETARVDVTLTGPLPRTIEAPDIALWREAGGRARVADLSIRWGPLVAMASGTLELDARLQPKGTLNATVRGFAEVVDALVAEGILPANQGTFAKAALTFLAGQPDADGTYTLRAPLVIDDGTLSLGPVPVGRIPHIRWPEG